MESFRKEIQAKLLKYGSLKEIIKKNGVITTIDFAVSNFLDQVSKRFYLSNSNNYGLFEAFFHSRDIDRWSRYVHVVNELRKTNEKRLSVLDVGSGGKDISGFLNPLARASQLPQISIITSKTQFKHRHIIPEAGAKRTTCNRALGQAISLPKPKPS